MRETRSNNQKRKEIDNLSSLKIKSFFTSKDTIKKMEWEATDWEKPLAIWEGATMPTFVL